MLCYKEHNGTDKDNVSYKASITESELVFSSIMTKEKKKRLQEERMKRKLVIEKENMKRVQEKNMIKAPKGILHPCFPKFVYKKYINHKDLLMGSIFNVFFYIKSM